jgi:hypothetical protein
MVPSTPFVWNACARLRMQEPKSNLRSTTRITSAIPPQCHSEPLTELKFQHDDSVYLATPSAFVGICKQPHNRSAGRKRMASVAGGVKVACVAYGIIKSRTNTATSIKWQHQGARAASVGRAAEQGPQAWLDFCGVEAKFCRASTPLGQPMLP